MTDAMDRFAERDEIVRSMRRQRIVQGKREVAEGLADAGELVAFVPGAELMRQGGRDDDCYFLLFGTVELKVNGDPLPYGRGAGEVVGEFNAVNPAIARTATVTAVDQVVALKCSAAALKAACNQNPELWEALAVELTHKILQRNQLVSAVNERPRIFMVATEGRIEVAEALCTALMRDYDVDLWREGDLVPPGGYQLDALHTKAKGADFGIVFAHPDDLADAGGRAGGERWETVRFELGYLMSELTRYRTLVMVPGGSGEAPRLFKGVQPMTYELPADGLPMHVAIARAVEDIRALVGGLKSRSRIAAPA